MTAVITSEHKVIDCPHCKGKLNVEIERQPATVQIKEEKDFEAAIARMIDTRLPKPVVEEKPAKKEKPIASIPSHLPRVKCKNCSEKNGSETFHVNENYRRPKHKCNNCGEWSGDGKGECLMCGAKDDYEELDNDELDALGIMKQEVKEHEHDHE